MRPLDIEVLTLVASGAGTGKFRGPLLAALNRCIRRRLVERYLVGLRVRLRLTGSGLAAMEESQL